MAAGEVGRRLDCVDQTGRGQQCGLGEVGPSQIIGIDIPTSWALIGEEAPDRSRSRMLGLTNVLWNLGPVVVLLLAVAVAPIR